MITNENGAVVSRRDYTAFGEESATAQRTAGLGYDEPEIRKNYTSYDRSNATGLDYAINRTYDSKQGRFTQVDPIGMSAVDLNHPQTFNLYAYCGNDPINHVDPDGLFIGKLFKRIGKIIKAIMIAVAVIIAVTAIITMPALLPALGGLLFAKLFALSGMLLVMALAPPKFGIVIGLAIGIILGGPGIIVNFADTVKSMPAWQKLLAALNFVGAIAMEGSNETGQENLLEFENEETIRSGV